MLKDNDYYGHSDVLRAWAQAPYRAPLPGRLQHGWNPAAGLDVLSLGEPWTKFLWSARNLTWCEQHGVAGAEAIGAPFLYLPPSEPVLVQPASLLVFPFHGWERASVAGDFELYADAVSELAGLGYTSITVCLYWMEYDDPSLREIFERRGWRVVTNGHRDGNPEFLAKQRNLLLSHSAVTSNRICTAAFYALACHRPFFLHGPSMGLTGTDDPDGTEFDAWQRQTFEALTAPVRATDTVADDDPRWAIGLAELGAEFVLQPEALRRRMRWRRVDGPLRSMMRLWPPVWRQLDRLR